ncbi:hypothetical protein LY56_00078 [Roseinatronobacter thiooxidans]|jgi:hypothetical protein|uniref:Uncharacterized protein n=1 Tax=Roseinatronobacter thiooxidans TaxID=121821 RepID=A0A2W7QII0_9RHOB|nr:hypothetical protein LY56_00078 [Roseinatronobacter thiooxidans]
MPSFAVFQRVRNFRIWPFAKMRRAVQIRLSSIPFIGGRTEQAFRAAFCMLPQGRKNDLILYYQRKHSCSRKEAMQRAIEDRARENGYRM